MLRGSGSGARLHSEVDRARAAAWVRRGRGREGARPMGSQRGAWLIVGAHSNVLNE